MRSHRMVDVVIRCRNPIIYLLQMMYQQLLNNLSEFSKKIRKNGIKMKGFEGIKKKDLKPNKF